MVVNGLVTLAADILRLGLVCSVVADVPQGNPIPGGACARGFGTLTQVEEPAESSKKVGSQMKEFFFL